MDKTKSKISLFRRYLKINLLAKIFFAIVLGTIVGIILVSMSIDTTKYIAVVKPFGDIFIRLLKMIVVPVISLSLITGAASISPSKLGSVGIKTIALYLMTSALAVFLGLFFANVFKPGLGLNLLAASGGVVEAKVSEPMSVILLNIIPTNPIESLAKGDVLPIIFFSILLGLTLSILKENGVKYAQVALDAIEGLVQAVYIMVNGIMQYAPFGVFALISIVFATNGKKVLGPLLFVVIITYLAYLAQLFIVYGSILSVNRLNIITFFKKGTEALITAFVTRSSGGTLPISMRNVEEGMGVPRSIASFTMPLGATINMNGTAIYLGVCAMFVGYATGNELTISQQIITIITATLAAIGTAGIPGAGAIMLLMVFESIGLNVTEGPTAAAYAMILGIDVVLDMGRTCLNVAGDMVCSVLVAKSENELDESKWK